MGELNVERTGPREGVARNGRGAELRYGPIEVDGRFTPGELLALALAACNVMSADHVLTRRLGADTPVTATVTTTKNTAENRYVDAAVDIGVDLSGLDEQARDELRAVVARAVDRGCTVGRTVDAGLPHTLTLDRV